MTTTSPLPLKIAILVNISPASPYEKGIKFSFVDAFNILAPNAIVDFYDPVIKGGFPDPKEYELVVLSGRENILGGESWIGGIMGFVRVVREEAPQMKVGDFGLPERRELLNLEI